MFGLGMPEVILILVIALVVYGPSKLPEMGAAMGKAIREFQRNVKEPEPEPIRKAAAGEQGDRKEEPNPKAS